MTVRQMFVVFVLFAPASVLALGLLWPPINWLFVLLLPVLFVGAVDFFQTRHTLRRLYPVVGRFRYVLEAFRKEIQQYFVETETSGMPVSREFRSLIYQRAKGDRDTRPFGTVFDVNLDGYEWVNIPWRPGLSPIMIHGSHLAGRIAASHTGRRR
jgi:hypothetical protein